MLNLFPGGSHLLAAALLALWSGAAQAQVTIAGRVVDVSGGALAGASVFASSASTGQLVSAQADAHGLFQLALREGRHRITAAASGFESASTFVDVPGAARANLVLRLAPAILNQSLVVSGARDEELREDSVTRVELVTRSQILDSGYERVSDILAEETGIVTRSGASGSRSETQIQGIDSRQSLILLDGYPVVGARGIKRGIINMDRQSANRLERIEIVKGASSALFGSDAIAGVINMITREPRHRLDANATASGGSLGTSGLRGDMGFLTGGWSGFLSAERHQRDGYDLTPAIFGTTGPGFVRYDYLAKVSRDLSQRFKVSLLANAFDNRDDARLLGERGPSSSVTNDSAQNYGATLNAALTGETLLQVRGYFGKYDESSAIDFLQQGSPVDETANLNEHLYRLEASVSHALGAKQLLQAGWEWTANEYRGYNRLLGDNAGQRISMGDAWINDRIQLHPRLSLAIGGRLSSHSRYGTAFVPRAGILYRLSDGLRLRASWGQGFRAPDLGQLYFRFQNPAHFYQVIGNPNLMPERSTTVQAGMDYRLGRITLSGTYFRNDIRNVIQADLIGRPSTPQQLERLLSSFGIPTGFNPGLHRLFFLYRNLDDVFTTGAEGRVVLNLTRQLMVSSGYTYLDARDKESGAFLSQRHRHHGNFRFWWSTRRLGGLRTNLRGTYFGTWPVVGRTGTAVNQAYQIWDWYVAKPVNAGFEMYVALDNLFDSVDPNLATTPPSFFRADFGRTFRVGVRWNFRRE